VRIRPRNAACLIAIALAAISVGSCGGTEEDDSNGGADSGGVEAKVSGSLPSAGDLLFVLRGPATVTDDRLEVEAETVEWFTDRPQRRAGVAPIQDLIDDWSGYGFDSDPPNAALAGPRTDAVVALSDPEAVDSGVAFGFSSLRGEVEPGDAGSLSIFIDSSANRCYIDVTNNTSYGWQLDGYAPGSDSWSEGDPGGGPDATIAAGGSMGSAFNDDEGVIDYKSAGADQSSLAVGTDCTNTDGNTRATELYCEVDGPAGAEVSCSRESPGRHAVFTLEQK
jgi:hypothetical protein